MVSALPLGLLGDAVAAPVVVSVMRDLLREPLKRAKLSCNDRCGPRNASLTHSCLKSIRACTKAAPASSVADAEPGRQGN